MKKGLIMVAIGIIIVLLSMVIYKWTKAPVLTYHSFSNSQKQFLTTGDIPVPDSLTNNMEIDSLVRLLAYKQAMVILSEKDSIQLVIHYPGQVVQLYLHGVPILQSSMEYVTASRMLKNLKANLYYPVFSQPMEVSDIKSTIIKEPVVEVNAPKDPVEAELNAFQPDTLIQFPAFLKMELNNNIHVYLEQSKDLTFSEKKTRFLVKAGYICSTIWSFSKAVLTFKPYIHNPSITIGLPVADLRAIYRALPEHPYLVLYVSEK